MKYRWEIIVDAIVLLTVTNGLTLLMRVERSAFGTSASSVPTTRRAVCIPSLRLCIITCRRYLLVKLSADCIKTNLTNSTHVNFSQVEYFVCKRFNFYV